ncbi:unnamed protein product [Nezara viridula]|uniref:General transcription factor 3C polypeptide 5 n=1 Tax=Nezara viridula TaxID=85310 RepID=A0A9P0H1V2_NEZVI|nr:unnamed protein product [Nezara viridula]
MELKKENLNNFYSCIEYPGIVKNVDKALETLGGTSEISKVCSKTNRRLELRFRPNDVFCKPACGDRYKTNGIILKIKVVKRKSENGEEIGLIKNCEILGRVTTSFKFKSICDFQFLPMMKMPDGCLEDISESLLPKRVDGDHLRQWLGSPASYFLPPAAFSRIDSQSLNTYMFRRDTKDKNDQATGSLIGRTRKRRSGHAVFVSFNIPKVPTKPREKAIKFLEVKFLNGQQLEIIKKCFEERPIWSKLALMCVTSFQHDQLKYLLPVVAYYFVTGPFRVMWVRFGYDPRKDPNSRIYQTLDYRIRAPAGLLSLVKAKRSDANYLLPSKSTHTVAKSVVITKDVEAIEQSGVVDGRIKKDSYIYQPNCLPPARQMFYQYCDIKVAEIEAMLGRLPKVVNNAVCDLKHGWLPSGFDNQCRDIINIYVTKQLNKAALAVGSSSLIKEEAGADDSTDNEDHWEEEFDEEEVDESDEA